MANEKHLAILKQGARVWNEWSKKNFLFGADLRGADLRGADLRNVDLSMADLNRANFSEADLMGANLQQASLIKANFREADLRGANLNLAILEETKLRGADLRGANLSLVHFYKASLVEAKCNRANLKQAYLSKANLNRADLSEANISRASLTEANLYKACLWATQALETNFQSATLTGVCIEDWNINSQTNLDEVICNYVYLKGDYQERRPHDPNKNFAPGEFTKLVQKALETVDLIFSDGIVDLIFSDGIVDLIFSDRIVDLIFSDRIDWQVFLTSFQQLQVQSGDNQLSVQAIEKKPDGAFVIRVEVPPDIDKAFIETFFWQTYKPLLKAKEEQIAFYSQEVEIKREENTKLLGIIEIMAENESQLFNDYQIQLLQAINQSLSHEKQLAQRLNLPIHRVKYYLEVMQKQGYLIYSEGSPFEEVGEPEYSDCRLTNKGKVAAENPSNLIKESIMAENRTINTGGGNYNENKKNVGINHMSGGEIKEGAKVAGVINEAEQQNLAKAIQIIESLRKNLEVLVDREACSEAVEHLNDLEAEAREITPKPSRLKASLLALWNIGKDITAIANGITALAQRFGISIPHLPLPPGN